MFGGTHWGRDQHGFSLVETLVVIIIISIVAAIALMQRGSANEQFKRQGVARELKAMLERARFDSVKRRADTSGIRAKVVVDTTSFTLTTDRNQDGVLDASDNQATDISGQNIVIAGDGGITLPVTITYDQRGEATATDVNGQVSPVFLVCNASCSGVAAANSNIILVTPTGTVNLLAGGTAIPTFSAPTGLTNVSPGNSINNYAAVTPSPTP